MLRWNLYRWIRGGWHLLNRFDTEQEAWAYCAWAVQRGARFKVLRDGTTEG